MASPSRVAPLTAISLGADLSRCDQRGVDISSARLTGADLADAFHRSGVSRADASEATGLDRWEAGAWEGHRCGLPVNAFPLQTGRGYFVRLTRPAIWAPVGAGPVLASSIRNTTEASTPVAPSLGVVRP